ncbi:MAG: hypothetical protein MUF64_24180 [Polyangiaceae bacterium]|nr:hypothetical protein [Polyangiaceae bacterium]
MIETVVLTVRWSGGELPLFPTGAIPLPPDPAQADRERWTTRTLTTRGERPFDAEGTPG